MPIKNTMGIRGWCVCVKTDKMIFSVYMEMLQAKKSQHRRLTSLDVKTYNKDTEIKKL